MEQSEKGECLIGEQETDPVTLIEDPYAVAWKLQKKDKLVPVVTLLGKFRGLYGISNVWWKSLFTSAHRASKAIPNTIRWPKKYY